MAPVKLLAIATVAFTATACSISCAKEALLSPALLSTQNPEQTAHLELALGQLAQKRVVLPAHAFSQSHQLRLAEPSVRSLNNPRGLGMEHQEPQSFSLLTDGKTCWVLHQNTQQKAPLPKVHCQSLTP
jgi:hypothetical protein